MILEGANKLKEENEYIIYAMNSANAGQYCVVVPNNATGTYNMLIDVHHKSLFDEVTSGIKTKEDLMNTLSTEYADVKKQNESGILVVPMLNEVEFKNAINNLDKQKMFDETKKIGAITSELYKKMTESGIDKQRINQKIMIVEKEAEDEKYVNWLKEQMPNYVEGMNLQKKEEVQSTTSNEAPILGDIFGAPTATPTQESAPTQTIEPAPVEEVAPPAPEASVDAPVTNGIFGSTPTTTAPTAPATPEPTPAPIPEQNVDIFGVPVEQPAAPVATSVQQPVQTPEPTQTTTSTNIAPETITPVQSVELEGTTTFSPIPDNQAQSTENPQDTSTGTTEPPKKNGGFVNLAIIMVVLIGVTVVSIELGKFLYSIYGA